VAHQGAPKTGDMYFTSWGNGSLDPFDIFTPTHRTNDRGNSAGYANPELDALLDAAAVELDVEKRRAMYAEAEAMINADAALRLPLGAAGHLRRLQAPEGLEAERRQPHQPARRLRRLTPLDRGKRT
jgi:ABC-type oligopeptide transport system substrate-binding subunit